MMIRGFFTTFLMKHRLGILGFGKAKSGSGLFLISIEFRSVFLVQVIEQIDGADNGIDTQGGDRLYHAGLATGFIDIEIHQCPRIAAKCISFLKAIVRSSASLTSLIPVSIVFILSH